MRQWLGLLAIALMALSPGAQAQVVPADGLTDNGRVAPFSDMTMSVDEIDVNVRMLVADPDTEGVLRLVLQLTNTADRDRRILFTGPRTTLIDDFGNVLRATSTVGVESCIRNRRWENSIGWCGSQRGNIATRLAPNIPVTVAIRFAPGDSYSRDLAAHSTTASLRSRIAHYANDLSDGKTADIIINDLPFPR